MARCPVARETGSVTVKVEPTPGVLATSTVPSVVAARAGMRHRVLVAGPQVTTR